MIRNWICTFIEEDKAYFATRKREITAQNNRMLASACLIYACVLTFYTLMTSLLHPSDILKTMYYVFDVLHVALCACVFLRPEKIKNDHRATQFYCFLLECSILSFFVLEAAYASQTQHSLYVPIAILLVLLLFIHKAPYTVAVMFAYASSCAILSFLYKTPEAYMNDLYIAVATFISSNIGYVLISNIRHSEGATLCKYESLSRTDPLTGLLNKSAMVAACEQILFGSDRACALFILDLDDFKGVNDAFGHDIGDEVLYSVGQALRSSVRELDRIGRFGGDEFIVLMDNCREPRLVVERVEKIIGRVDELRFSRADLRVHCSVGIALKREADDFQSIFKRADQALYEAKADGKGKCRLSEPV